MKIGETMDIGDKVPDFSVATNGGGTLRLSDFKGKKVILYFYPKDDTPGCTKEAQGFKEVYGALKDKGVEVIGISKDSVKKHDKFVEKYDLPFPLGADEEGAVCEAYGTWVEKSMYGRQYMGIDRATFLIDASGCLLQVWHKVKVPGHVKAVLTALGLEDLISPE